jgi:hypothetical protein
MHKARFCLATGVSPSEYEGLTWFEIDAYISAMTERE